MKIIINIKIKEKYIMISIEIMEIKIKEIT